MYWTHFEEKGTFGILKKYMCILWEFLFEFLVELISDLSRLNPCGVCPWLIFYLWKWHHLIPWSVPSDPLLIRITSVFLYVDDLLVTEDDIRLVMRSSNKKWCMLLNWYILALWLISWYWDQMDDCKAANTPMKQKEKFSQEDGADKVDEGYYRSLIGCLMHLIATRPDILFIVILILIYAMC